MEKGKKNGMMMDLRLNSFISFEFNDAAALYH